MSPLCVGSRTADVARCSAAPFRATAPSRVHPMLTSSRSDAGACSRRSLWTVVPKAVDTSERSTATPDIQGLDRNYCDDFVCTSSPAVEQTVRSFARDLERGVRYTPALFAREAKYSDGFRSFSGTGPLMRPSWVQDAVRDPKVTVNQLQMLDKATARVSWRLAGSVGMAPIDVPLVSVIEMNLLTGKILSLKESWDASRLAGPIAVVVNASRASWAAKQASMDAQEGLGKVADSISSMASTDEDSNQIYRDPADPTKFFQQNNDQNYNDMITFAMFMIAMYAIYQGFATVLKV